MPYNKDQCHDCGKPRDRNGKGTCISCYNKYRKRIKEFEEQNICTSCFNNKTDNGFIQCQLCRHKLNQRNKARHVVLRNMVLNAYGSICACCSESTKLFLAIDHINNNGTKHRKQIHSGDVFNKWLRDHNYPSDYRILCHNCNQGRHINGGTCPGNPKFHKLAIQQHNLLTTDSLDGETRRMAQLTSPTVVPPPLKPQTTSGDQSV